MSIIMRENNENKKDEYVVGDTFMCDGIPMMLVRVDDYKVALISLLSGNRWTNPIRIEDGNTITNKELAELYDGDIDQIVPCDFELVKKG